MRNTDYQCKKNPARAMIAVVTALCMMFVSAVPASAAVNQWNGFAENDALIKDTITNITSCVTEHEVITNVSDGSDQKIDYIGEIRPDENIKVVAGYGRDNADKWSLTRTTSQAAAYEKNHPGETVVAAINADFFNMATGEPMGALVMEGQVKHGANGRYYFGITKDGKPVIRNSEDLSDLSMAVGGDMVLVRDGQVVEESTEYGNLKYSRTAIGYKPDGTIVTFVTYGKRPPISCGRTYREMAEMFAAAGCEYALALDGGGSSTWAARPEGTDKLTVRNTPNDGAEREVSSSVLIVSKEKATGVFDHVQITPNNEVYTPNSSIKFEAKGADTAGFPVDIPADTQYALADDSSEMGTIDAATGEFKANDKTGVVTVNMVQGDKVVGQTSIEVAVPDKIYFANEEISLGFDEESTLGLVVRNKERDMHYNDGDFIWSVSDESMGAFTGNIFKSSEGNSVTGTVTCKSVYDESVSGEITVIVGKLPTIVWDFEDTTDSDGNPVTAEEYYIGSDERAGILTHKNYGRGGKESIEIVSIDDDEPVRFGAKSMKLNYDFTECKAVTEGACIGTTETFTVPGIPTKIGVWVYAPEGVGVEWGGQGTQAGFWLRGYVNGNVGYDFTLEPKVFSETGEPPADSQHSQPGIYWEGWKYLEADLSKIAPPYNIPSGMALRLMYVAGTKMGTKTANSIYFDNFQFVYGTNVDDVDNPVVDSITLNNSEIGKNTVIDKSTVNIDAIVSDVENKYTSGVDSRTVRMYIDGENVVNNDKYQFVYDASGQIAHLYDVKLSEGKHSVTVSLRDGFGNETSETRYFTVNTGSTEENTTVNVVPSEENALLGGTVNLQIKASDDSVTDNTTSIKLDNMFTDYDVTFSDNYDGTVSYSKMTKTITIKAQRKEAAQTEDDHVIATLSVKIPSTLKDGDYFTYTVKNGRFETSTGGYDTYSTDEIKIPVAAGYNVSAEPVIIGGSDCVIKVTTADGEGAESVSVYTVDGDALIGVTDAEGKLVTSMFNSDTGSYPVYAKDKSGMLSFQYKVMSYDAQCNSDGTPQTVRFNVVSDPTKEKNITWLSNPLAEGEQTIRYAPAGTEEWTVVKAESKLTTFVTGGNKIANINSALISGLTPDTEYDYIIGTEEAFTDKATFKTDAEGRTDTEFFVIGDIQNPDKTNLEAIVDKLNATGKTYNFGIQTGDAIDQGTDFDDWNSVGQILGAKKLADTNIISIMGNHEYYGDPDTVVASAMYNNPNTAEGAYYSVEYGNVYIATVNFATTVTQIREAAEWLVEDAAKSDATWKILCSHQPPYYTNYSGGNDPVYDVMPDAIEEAGIDVVFSGHDHSFARTNSLKDDKQVEDGGTIYYICGSTGGKVYPITTQDKFDYDEIFKYVSVDYSATYLTASSDENKMTINMYDLEGGLIDSVTIETECSKYGHELVYKPKSNVVVCNRCGKDIKDYTGEVKSAAGYTYYLIKGVKQTGWVPVGEEFRYYGKTGAKQEVTAVRTEKDCVTDTTVTYTASSGAVKVQRYNDAGGHEYVEQDGKWICSVCGHERIKMEDCKYKLSYKASTYTGNAKKPAVTVTAPDGSILVAGAGKDYKAAYSDNVEVGKASVTLTAVKIGKYVNINDWRGNCEGSKTLHFTILPDAPKDVIAYYQANKINLSWTAAQQADQYLIYKSSDGNKWSYVGSTTRTSYNVRGLDNPYSYKFRIYSKKKGSDGATYESTAYASSRSLVTKINAYVGMTSGCPILEWNAAEGVKYTVYRSASEYGTYTKLTTTSGGSFKDTGAVKGKTYYYKVKSTVTKTGDAAMSKVYSLKARCGRPVVTVRNNATTGKPVLKWNAVKSAVKYEVYRSTSGQSGTYEKLATIKGTYITNKSAVKGKTYYYKVRALSSNGIRSTFSKPVKIKCL